ncbi:conjugal transfer protein TraP [Salmonella enterica subsp. enterica serovar Legon]|nr:conjugal transfer protein TraP [Salmonella enterica subsp. enterica serovar Legon]
MNQIDTDIDDETSTEQVTDSAKLSFWQRPLLLGYSLPWVTGVVIILGAAGWYLMGAPLPSGTPSQQEFDAIENASQQYAIEPPVEHQADSMNTPAATPAPTSEIAGLASDVRDELNARDKVTKESLRALQDSITQLSDAIKKDEAFARETREKLIAIQTQLSAAQPKQAAVYPTKKNGNVSNKRNASPTAGMKIVSLERGMAWIRWQDSTWAVREGEELGKVIITRIDPSTRSVVTSGGTLH